MTFDIEDAVHTYLDSERFFLLDAEVKEYAEPLLSCFLREAERASDGFPEGANALVFQSVLQEKIAHQDVPAQARKAAPDLLCAFFEHLAASGAYPPAETWSGWISDARDRYVARFREDGTVKGETFRREFKRVGRNDPCPCGSGKKFKKCCMGLLS